MKPTFENEAHNYIYHNHALAGRYAIYQLSDANADNWRNHSDDSQSPIIDSGPVARCNGFSLAAKWMAIHDCPPYRGYVVVASRRSGGDIVMSPEFDDKVEAWRAVLAFK